jgi:hypothetical protein
MIPGHRYKYSRIKYYSFSIKSLDFCRSFNQVDAQFSKSTLHRAARCIQRWWRGFIVRHRWNYLKGEVCSFFSILIFVLKMINQRLRLRVYDGRIFLLVIVELLNVFKKCVNQNIDNLYLILIKREIF